MQSNMTERRNGSTSEKVGNNDSNTGQSETNKSNSNDSVSEKKIDLDHVLVNELGQFGRFQLINLLLVAIPMIMSAFPNEYVFSAAAVSHRCMIPECGETAQNAVYNAESLQSAFPQDESCQRYYPLGGNGTLEYCPAILFDQNRTIGCDNFVYERNNSVVYEYDLGCQNWLRALAGTLNGVGTLLVLPITGFISDRWGRRVALVINIFNLALIGLIRAFSVNYSMYLVLQILQTTLGAGTYSSSYVFAAEMVGPKYRVLTSATCSSSFATGQVVLGVVAWLVQPWRSMIMTLHIPCFLVITYYWILPESVRWLLSKGKYDRARKTLEKVARVNKRQISEKSMNALTTAEVTYTDENARGPGLFMTIVKSKILRRRVCTTPIWWITNTFVYYGLSLNSSRLSVTNIYLSYILTCAIEIPGYYTAAFVLNRIGRRTTLSFAFFFSAVCNIAFILIPDSLAILGMIVFLLGKFCISMVMTSVYLYTSELYPTECRHTLLALSSMIGRIGSTLAPLTPVLAEYWEGIPSAMFATLGVLSGLLVLTQPETLGTRLPDTLAQAEALGRPESKLPATR